MAQNFPSLVLPETDTDGSIVWPEGIYQLAIHEMATGYDPDTGIDGLSNIAPKQLTQRTRWSKSRMDAEHSVDDVHQAGSEESTAGLHQLKSADLAEGIKIEESKLHLDFSTESLEQRIRQLQATLAAARVESKALTDEALSLAISLQKLWPLSEKYTGLFCAYELFVENYTLLDLSTTDITKHEGVDYAAFGVQGGDDSIDLVSIEGIEPGKTYILSDADGARPEYITVRQIMPMDRRILCTEPVTYTRDGGYLSMCNLRGTREGSRTADGRWMYVCEDIRALSGVEHGALYVNRTWANGLTVRQKAYVMVDDSGEWDLLEFGDTAVQQDGTATDCWPSVPGGSKVKFRIEYTLDDPDPYPYDVFHIVIAPKVEYIRIDQVYRPEITIATRTEGIVEWHGKRYLSLYGLEHKSTHIRLMSRPFIEDPYASFDFDGTEYDTFQIPPALLSAEQLYLQIQYEDIEGNLSEWSEVVRVEYR